MVLLKDMECTYRFNALQEYNLLLFKTLTLYYQFRQNQNLQENHLLGW